MPARLTFVRADQKSDRGKRGACGHHNKKKNKKAAQILLLRSGPYFPLRRHQNCQPIKREDNESERVPTGNCCGRESNMSTRGKEYHCSSNQSQGETMSRVLAVDKIDNAHLCSRVTIFGSSGKLPLQPLLPFG